MANNVIRIARRQFFRFLVALAVLPMLLVESGAAKTNSPVVIIYASGGMGATHSRPRIVAALWNDGKIIWSKSRVAGGPPLMEGRFEPDKLKSLLDKLEQDGVFSDQALSRAWFGPDASFTTIAIDDGSRQLKLRSWHELSERNTNTVATANGLSSLSGRDRDELLKQQPDDYRRFRKTWSAVRQGIAALIPESGEPYTGTIPIPRR